MLTRKDIRIRDPFILTDTENKCYYMYGTTALVPDSIAAGNTFTVYKTYDLENFEDGKVVVDGAKHDFWGERDFWAPEVYGYNGKYYLFGSCIAEGRMRATHVFVCDTPDGDFVPVSKDPQTPMEWMCLDGTLWIENGSPYMVFCHEWSQINIGTICAVPLSDDLSAPIGEPIHLFTATDDPDVALTPRKSGAMGAITDGPFLYTEDGKLRMIWSSKVEGGRYAVLLAESESGSVKGPWKHFGSRFDFDGGHAMLFYTLDGKRMISLHSPNVRNEERAKYMNF